MTSIISKHVESFGAFFERMFDRFKPYNGSNSDIKQVVEIVFSYVLRAVQRLIFWHSPKYNRIMVYAHARKGFSCNPKYIVQKLLELYGSKVEIIWVTMYPESCGEIDALGVRIVKNNSPEHMFAYFNTRVYITNDCFPFWALHRHNQIWINTWHGAMNYKHIGYDYVPFANKYDRKLFTLKNQAPDYFVSGSRFFTEDTAKAFGFDESVFLPTGLPRNDIFFKDNAARCPEIRKEYGIPEDARIVLYAPTFRKTLEPSTHGIDFTGLCRALKSRFGGDWVVMLRNHCFVSENSHCENVIDVSEFPDMQELLCAADVLISDYSSCLYDFCLTGRPSFVYAPDIESYESSDRSFAYPLKKWPYSIAKTNNELQQHIVQFNECAYSEKITQHIIETGTYDNGSASEQIAKLIEYQLL